MSVPFKQIADIVCLQLGRKTVQPGDRLLEDLGAESADLVNLVAAIEDRFRLSIPEEEMAQLESVADLHALVERQRS